MRATQYSPEYHSPCSQRSIRLRKIYAQKTLLLCCLLLLLMACKPSASAALPAPTPAPQLVVATFTTSTSYEAALLSITDLGLQLSLPCLGETVIDQQGQVRQWGIWRALGQKKDFSQQPDLFVASTPISPPDWFARLQALPNVKQVTLPSGNFSCPLSEIGPSKLPLPHGWLPLLSAGQAGTYSVVTFDASTDYPTALGALLNLGLRLADPCYEQAQAQGKSPAWHPMGQERSFAIMRQVLVATTTATATVWQDQVRAVPGVTAVETPYMPSC